MPIQRRTVSKELMERIHEIPVDAEYIEGEEYPLEPEKVDMIGFFLSVSEQAAIQSDREASDKLHSAEEFMTFSLANHGEVRHPKDVAVSELLRGVQHVQNPDEKDFANIEEFYRNRIRSPLTAIRAFCVISTGGPKSANKCDNTTCPFWAFRDGRNGFFGRR